MKKFKVELEIEVSESDWKDGDMSLIDYIEQELSWARESFFYLSIKKITELPV